MPFTAAEKPSDATDRIFVAGRPEDVELADMPINPDWITEGEPKARAGQHSISLDGGTSTHIWECSAGSFWWTFYEEETVYILDGAVRVTSETGEVRILQAGDIAYFAERTKAYWEIDHHVRKIAFLRHKPSGMVQSLRRVAARMRGPMIEGGSKWRLIGALGMTLPL